MFSKTKEMFIFSRGGGGALIETIVGLSTIILYVRSITPIKVH